MIHLMKKEISLIFIILFSTMACKPSPNPSNHENSKAAKDWFEEGSWYRGLSAQPDPSIDTIALYKHYAKHPGIWNQVFDFLRHTKLETLDTGKYILKGDSLFVIVDEYITQDVEERRYEAHRKYIDLQYIIKGEELIGVEKLAEVNLLESYDRKRDIAFYEKAEGNYRLADHRVFFIFFPNDAHQPCVKVDQSGPVKKIVFKIVSD